MGLPDLEFGRVTDLDLLNKNFQYLKVPSQCPSQIQGQYSDLYIECFFVLYLKSQITVHVHSEQKKA